MIAPLILVLLLLFAAALFAPLIPMRRRRTTGLAGFPIVTASLIVANLVIFAANAVQTEDGSYVLSRVVAENWGLTPHSASLMTFVTYMFLHATWDHVLGNMIGLWLFGPHVEEALGRVEYLLFYIASGIAGGLLHLFVTMAFMHNDASIPLVGASGAIFGVLGLFSVRFWRARVRVLLFLKIPAVWAMTAFAAIQVFFGLRSIWFGIHSEAASWAHVGGFAFGLLIAIPLRMREHSTREYAIEDAESALETGNLDKAAAHYRSVIEATPDDADAHQALGKICIRLRQTEAAHRHLQEAIRLNLRATNARAVAQVYAEAIAGFETFPQQPSLLQRVASSCEEVQQFMLAQHALSELCREHPDAKEAEMCLLRLGKLHLQKLGQPDNAVGIFSEFLRIYPDSEWAGHALRLRDEANANSLFGGVPFSAASAASQPKNS